MSIFHPAFLSVPSSSSTPPISTSPSLDSLALDFSTFLGVSNAVSKSIAVDNEGNIYVTGTTYSSNFPTKNAFQPVFGGGENDAFVSKFNSTGHLVFSTFFGGNYSDVGYAIAVDAQGNSYVTGSTFSSDFPIKTVNDSVSSGSCSFFVSKFDSSGNLIFSTCISNGNSGLGITLDRADNIYVTGTGIFYYFNSTDRSNTSYESVFVIKLDSIGNLIFKSFLYGSNLDYGNAIAVDAQGNSYITGSTDSSNFPTKNALQPVFNNNSYQNTFVAKLGPTGDLDFSTFLGGYGSGTSIATDTLGNCYVTGYTGSNDFPTKNAYNSTFNANGFNDAFVTKISTTGSLVFSTFLGGLMSDEGQSIAVDALGNSYITGETTSSNFPTKNAFDSTPDSQSNGYIPDTFIVKFNTTGDLVFSTFFGGSNADFGSGIAVDSSGNVYVTGPTLSPNFPTKNAYNSTYGGHSGSGANHYDVFIAKFSPSAYSSATYSHFPFIPSGNNNSIASTVIYDTILLSIAFICIVTIFEYRKYYIFKLQFPNKSHSSFYKYLLNKIGRNRKKPLVRNHISDKTFEILDEIEKETGSKE